MATGADWSPPAPCSLRTVEGPLDEAVALGHQLADIRLDLLERPQLDWLIEVTGEGDFVADFVFALRVHPGVRRVGAHLALDEGRHASRLQERNLLEVGEFRIRLVLD